MKVKDCVYLARFSTPDAATSPLPPSGLYRGAGAAADAAPLHDAATDDEADFAYLLFSWPQHDGLFPPSRRHISSVTLVHNGKISAATSRQEGCR